VINVVVIQNGMVTCVEAERVSDVTNEEDQEPTAIPVIKTEPTVSFVSAWRVTNISYMLYAELHVQISVCPRETKI
jgi:hypothetical protein